MIRNNEYTYFTQLYGDNNNMKDECYEFIKGPNNKISIVGFGSYGEVKLAKNSDTGEVVAIKMVHR